MKREENTEKYVRKSWLEANKSKFLVCGSETSVLMYAYIIKQLVLGKKPVQEDFLKLLKFLLLCIQNPTSMYDCIPQKVTDYKINDCEPPRGLWELNSIPL